MADTVEQLRTKLDEATRKAKAAYRAIHFSESFDKPSLEQQYNYAKQNNTKDLASIEAKWRKAQEEYANLQKVADDLDKQVKDAEKSGKEQETKKKTQDTAKAAYDKALKTLSDAEKNINFYGGDKKYTDAYNAAKNAFDAATKAGVMGLQVLPEQKIPVLDTKKEAAGTGAKGQQQTPATYSELLDVLADPKNKQQLIAVQNDLKNKWGWKGEANGEWTQSFQAALQKVETYRISLPKSLQSDTRAFLSKPTASTSGIIAGSGTGGPSTTTDVTKSVEKMTQADIDAMINKSAQDILGRDLTAADKSAEWYKNLNVGIQKMINEGTTYKTTSTTKTGGTTSLRTTTPGFTQEKAGQMIESTLKTADPESLARKERVDFMSWMFNNLGGR